MTHKLQNGMNTFVLDLMNGPGLLFKHFTGTTPGVLKVSNQVLHNNPVPHNDTVLSAGTASLTGKCMLVPVINIPAHVLEGSVMPLHTFFSQLIVFLSNSSQHWDQGASILAFSLGRIVIESKLKLQELMPTMRHHRF